MTGPWRRSAQSILEYATIIAIAAAMLWGMGIYAKKAVAGRWREVGDTFGQGRQYEVTGVSRDGRTDPPREEPPRSDSGIPNCSQPGFGLADMTANPKSVAPGGGTTFKWIMNDFYASCTLVRSYAGQLQEFPSGWKPTGQYQTNSVGGVCDGVAGGSRIWFTLNCSGPCKYRDGRDGTIKNSIQAQVICTKPPAANPNP